MKRLTECLNSCSTTPVANVGLIRTRRNVHLVLAPGTRARTVGRGLPFASEDLPGPRRWLVARFAITAVVAALAPTTPWPPTRRSLSRR